MTSLRYHLRTSWDNLKNKPYFTGTIVLTMGITLGALLCILTLAYSLIVQPLPYPDQQDLYRVEQVGLDSNDKKRGSRYSYQSIIHLYKNQSVFDKASLIYYSQDEITSLTSEPSMSTSYVTPEWFSLFDTPMIKGRMFEQTEAKDTYNPVVIISYKAWIEDFEGNIDILEQKLIVRDVSYRIVGVTANDFIEPQIYLPGLETKIWFPWDYNPVSQSDREIWYEGISSLVFVGKLDRAYTESQAEQMLTPLINDIWQEEVSQFDFFNGWKLEMKLSTLKSVILGDQVETVYLLIFGVVGLVLIAFANTTNLFISRLIERQHQLAICASFGANRRHLFNTVFFESVVLMFLSISFALFISYGGIVILQTNFSHVLPRMNELSINFFTLGVSIVILLIFAFIFSIISIKLINYRALNNVLRSSGKGTGVQVPKFLPNILIGSQVSVATILIFANIILFTNTTEAINEPLGFSTKNLLDLKLSVVRTPTSDDRKGPSLTGQIRTKLLQLPQVESISRSLSPLSGFEKWALTDDRTNNHLLPEEKLIDDHYFQMIDQPLLEGDFFTSEDLKGNNPVIIVNNVLANYLAPNASAVGLKLTDGFNNKYTIIGVVKGIKLPTSREIPMRVYNPNSGHSTSVMIKLKNNQVLSRDQVLKIIKEVTSLFSIFDIENVREKSDKALFTKKVVASVTLTLTMITLFLSGVGLYGILNYSIQIRRLEIGTRLAIGAKTNSVIRLIIRDNSFSLIAGMLVGLIVMSILYNLFTDTFVNYINGQSIPIFVITLLLLGSLYLFSCYWPLRRFISRPPIYAIRNEN